MKRICLLCYERIGNETYYFLECKNKEMIKVRYECMDPFYKNWKVLEKLLTEKLLTVLSSQNYDLLHEVRLICLRIQETFKLEAL